MDRGDRRKVVFTILGEQRDGARKVSRISGLMTGEEASSLYDRLAAMGVVEGRLLVRDNQTSLSGDEFADLVAGYAQRCAAAGDKPLGVSQANI